jgi:hypothetical protein
MRAESLLAHCRPATTADTSTAGHQTQSAPAGLLRGPSHAASIRAIDGTPVRSRTPSRVPYSRARRRSRRQAAAQAQRLKDGPTSPGPHTQRVWHAADPASTKRPLMAPWTVEATREGAAAQSQSLRLKVRYRRPERTKMRIDEVTKPDFWANPGYGRFWP